MARRRSQLPGETRPSSQVVSVSSSVASSAQVVPSSVASSAQVVPVQVVSAPPAGAGATGIRAYDPRRRAPTLPGATSASSWSAAAPLLESVPTSPRPAPPPVAARADGTTLPGAISVGFAAPPRAVATATHPPRHPSAARRGTRAARVIVVDNGAGLSRDREVVAEALRCGGWDVSFADPRGSPPDFVDVNVYLEIWSAAFAGSARKEVVIPNPEWWNPKWSEAFRMSNVRVWAKTADAARAFRALGARVAEVGFRSADRRDNGVPRERRFLHVGGASPLKGTAALVAAWRESWPPLTVVARQHPGPGASNVAVVLGHIPDAELRRLQNACAFHAYPSRYEGFGHAAWEALSCGAVVVVPTGAPFDEWPLEFVRAEAVDAAPLAAGLVCEREVSPAALAAAVESVASMTDDELVDQRAASRRAWEVASSEFTRRVAVEVGGLADPVVVTIHSPHERCGIREYGRQLDTSLEECGLRVVPTNFADAEAAVSAADADSVLLVHFEWGLLQRGFRDVLARARVRGARVVFCCHWFGQRVVDEFDDLVDRFVAHRDYADVFDERVVELPLACPNYAPPDDRRDLRRRLGLPEDATILVTAGFLSAWKEYPVVVDAVMRRWPRDGEHFLQVLAPLPFHGDATGEEVRVRRVVASYPDLAGRVLFSTDFRTEVEVLDRIYASDVGFVFHRQDTGSVSAAAKLFVATRRPFVVTSSSHVSDVRARGGASCVESRSPDALADEVWRLARDGAARDRVRAAADAEYEKICMDAVARRYRDLLREL